MPWQIEVLGVGALLLVLAGFVAFCLDVRRERRERRYGQDEVR